MRVLITWGSERGGTEGIARIIAETLRDDGIDVAEIPAREVRDLDGHDAVIVGGALYANRWHRDARRFVGRNAEALRRRPVWFFSSGPLDDSAAREAIAPTGQVQVLMERVGALGHVTFGGRLEPDARGFPASAMARKMAGDWRDPDRIRAWASEVAGELPAARPGEAIDHPARSVPRLVGYALAGWLACAALLLGVWALSSTGVALAVHAIGAPVVFAVVGWRYFAPRGAREPPTAALAFTAIVAALHLAALAWLVPTDLGAYTVVVGAALPLALIFASTWLAGFIASTLPWPKAAADHGAREGDEPVAAPAAPAASAPSGRPARTAGT